MSLSWPIFPTTCATLCACGSRPLALPCLPAALKPGLQPDPPDTGTEHLGSRPCFTKPKIGPFPACGIASANLWRSSSLANAPAMSVHAPIIRHDRKSVRASQPGRRSVVVIQRRQKGVASLPDQFQRVPTITLDCGALANDNATLRQSAGMQDSRNDTRPHCATADETEQDASRRR